jgi:hypothetical protein
VPAAVLCLTVALGIAFPAVRIGVLGHAAAARGGFGVGLVVAAAAAGVDGAFAWVPPGASATRRFAPNAALRPGLMPHERAPFSLAVYDSRHSLE